MTSLAWLLTTGVIATGLLSTLVVYLGMGYAERRGLLDVPGQRRSHQVATPRGGGIGIVIAALLAVGLPLLIVSDADGLVAASVGGLLLVALVGWIDDHNGLPARIRFAAHLLASLALALALLWPVLAMFSWLPSLLMLGVIVFSTAWSINLHNFMDGIDGLLAVQAIFVFVALGAVGLVFGSAPAWLAILVAAAAVVGFLPFNFPKARIFMGDVGSGALGLLVAVVVLYQIGDRSLDAATGLIACSAFATDATATLLSRILRGRRWYDAHREHLYQGLVRSGYSHARVVGFYLGWNLLVALPAMLLIQSPRSVMAVDSFPLPAVPSQLSARGLVVMLIVYTLALATWMLGKRHCLQRARHGGQHGLA